MDQGAAGARTLAEAGSVFPVRRDLRRLAGEINEKAGLLSDAAQAMASGMKPAAASASLRESATSAKTTPNMTKNMTTPAEGLDGPP